MGILEFIAAMAWPAVAVYGIWTIRHPLQGMMERILPTKLDAWGFKAEFEKRLDKVEVLTETNKEPEGATSTSPAVSLPKPSQIKLNLEKPPEMRILRAWNRLGRSIQRHPKGKLRTDEHVRWDTSEWIDEAARSLGLAADETAALLELQALRNKVAHSTDVALSKDDAARYEEVSDRLMDKILKKSEIREPEVGRPL